MVATSLSLLERARASPRDGSWDQFVELYTPLIRAWARKANLHTADSDDLIQEVLLTVARDLPRFEHSQRTGAFRNWLRAILLNRVRNHLRAKAHRPNAHGGTSWGQYIEQLADDGSEVSREWDREHDRYVLAGILQQVQPRVDAKTWQAFHLQVFGQKRPDAVATELGMPLNSVYVARSRVLAMLRKEAAGLIESA
jgi:RNA polymerase sigma factor (sigma-70 family)